MSILKLENVGYRYKDAPKDSYVFKNVNYEFEQGKMYAIKGKSGSGKTTLLSLLAGLDEPRNGEILYNNQNIKAQTVLEINANHEIANKLKDLYKNDKDELKKYTQILYAQARLIEGLNIENPTELSNLICEVMSK